MDDLINSLSSSVSVSEPLSSETQHPHYALYKARQSKSSQDERRKQLLAIQKEKREELLNRVRNLVEEDLTEEEENGTEDEHMDVTVQTKRNKSISRAYRNQLMLSEWLVEPPEDFQSDWLMVPCPEGKRCLIVAAKGVTKVFAKSGFQVTSFPSGLPGGNRSSASKGPSILDCIWNPKIHSYFVLDLLCWNNMPLTGCEAEFRFYWLKNHLSESSADVQIVSPRNRYRILPLPCINCENEALTNVMTSEAPFGSDWSDLKLDGLLFYHKRTFYTNGITPLVLWLKPYMLPDIIHIPVAESYLTNKPCASNVFRRGQESVKKTKSPNTIVPDMS